jgi:hypothetical protein
LRHPENQSLEEAPKMDILALFHYLQPHVTATTLRQLSMVALALLGMTGVTTHRQRKNAAA